MTEQEEVSSPPSEEAEPVVESQEGDITWMEPTEPPVDHGEEVYGTPKTVEEQDAYLKNAVPQAHEGVVGSDFFDPDGDWRKTKIGETPSGQEVFVSKREEGNGYFIRYGKGVMPSDMHNNWYTSYSKAEAAARGWLNKLHADAENSTETTDG